MKIFCGVTSLNQVDTIIDFCRSNPEYQIIFIPSRRQIDHDYGYVNNWTTSSFSHYIRMNGMNIKIERDHAGPLQGLHEDDGFESLREDCLYFDIIHLDPWKKYSDLHQGIDYTIKMINFCYELNPMIEYEIATEEAIRPFEPAEVEEIILQLRQRLPIVIYKQIKYCVVQCGNKLCDGRNSNFFDKTKLSTMIEIVKKNHMIPKEHNGDWVLPQLLKQKKELGLECINIAPEFGMIESTVILENIKKNEDDYEQVYQLCLESNKWKKWVSHDFDPSKKKDDLILITCHYIYSDPRFKDVKNNYKNIDDVIREKLFFKLLELHNIFEVRTRCIFCHGSDLKTLLEKDYKTSITLGLYEEPHNGSFIPYNIQLCNQCNGSQIKYIGNLGLVYHKNHIDNYGITKNKKHESFAEFISKNKSIQNIVEIGACQNVLATLLKTDHHYCIIEPCFKGDSTNLTIIPNYFENVDIRSIQANTIIMSDVFEHFYNPDEILTKIRDSPINYIYLCHPDFDYGIQHNTMICLNIEHTFLIEHSFLVGLFQNHGFRLDRRLDYENLACFFEFRRAESLINPIPLIDFKTRENVMNYIEIMSRIVAGMNTFMEKYPHRRFFIWPFSMHSMPFFIFGLNYLRLSGILDNSPNKIGKYMSAYNLKCYSLTALLEKDESDTCIFISGAGNYIRELDLKNDKKIDIRFLHDFL